MLLVKKLQYEGYMYVQQHTVRARKIFEFHLARWASNPQILLARDTSPLPKFSNSLIIHDEPKNGSQTRGVF